MFTGIVECIGTITSLTTTTGGTTLTISTPPFLLSDAHLGDSISINGTCLTITTFTPSPPSFTVGVSPETLRRTNLGRLEQSSNVNLERAVSAHTRMGGHFVQGHVDTVATIVGVVEDGEARVLRFRPRERDVLRFVVEKGYVTIDGASLTVTRVSDDEGGGEGGRAGGAGGTGETGEEGKGWWEVMLIAYTQEKVVTAGKAVGDEVNVEVDMVGKYVEKSVRGYLEGLEGEGSGGGGGVLEKMVERIVERKIKSR
ncbi:MAG: hypothetical protein LQ339_001879 [Xanthoria mediterranea]|nr:MAG: hypothetical protein LQ339_001879 [Xanthoria mediterranea]